MGMDRGKVPKGSLLRLKERDVFHASLIRRDEKGFEEIEMTEAEII